MTKSSFFDWQGFGEAALSGGIADGDASQFGSYAVVSPDYKNLNMRFGFHFALIDCLCGGESRTNHCQLRFAGGGGVSRGKVLRILLLRKILERLGAEVQAQFNARYLTEALAASGGKVTAAARHCGWNGRLFSACYDSIIFNQGGSADEQDREKLCVVREQSLLQFLPRILLLSLARIIAAVDQ